MLVSIEKELQKKVQTQKERFKLDPVTEVENILNVNATKDRKLLTNLAEHSQYVLDQQAMDNHKFFQSLEEKYSGSVYQVDQIKDIAIKYKLRFVHSCFYAGSYDNEVASKLRSFCKDNKIKEKDVNSKFFILAPSEMLHLVGDIKHGLKIDPLLFYKIDDNHYRLIHKWGDDFTIFRQIKGFKWKGFWQYWLTNTLTLLPLLFVLSFMFTSNVTYSLLTSFGGSAALAHLIWNRNKLKDLKIVQWHFSPDNWNSCCNFKK